MCREKIFGVSTFHDVFLYFQLFQEVFAAKSILLLIVTIHLFIFVMASTSNNDLFTII